MRRIISLQGMLAHTQPEILCDTHSQVMILENIIKNKLKLKLKT